VFGFYRAKQPKSYYEGGNGYARAGELFDEMLDYFDGSVDFSKYDNDGDGKTDAVSIVYAGDAEVWGQGLWPHASGSNEKRDGVTISRYQMTNLGESFGLYTFSHEVGHMLFGWPDLYGFGNYCIMGNGSSQTNPVGINDLYRADQEWIPIVDVDRDTNAEYVAKPNDTGYRYTNPDDPGESFFWSNVQSSGRFATISGDGILLLHFDKGLGNNDPPNPLSLAVVQADGKKDLDQVMWPNPGSDPADYFHADGVDEFSEASFDTSSFNDGTPSGLRIYDIGPISEAISFKVGTGEIVVVPGTGGAFGSAGSGGSAGADGGAGGAAGSEGTNPGTGGSAVTNGGATGSSPSGGGNGGMSSGGISSAGMPPLSPRGAALSEEGCACRQVGRSGRAVPWALGLLVVPALRRRRERARA
jgi:M6 family metalloprotease-like protein